MTRVVILFNNNFTISGNKRNCVRSINCNHNVHVSMLVYQLLSAHGKIGGILLLLVFQQYNMTLPQVYLQYCLLGTFPNILPNQRWSWCWPEQLLSIAILWSLGGFELWKLRFKLVLFQRIEQASWKKHWRSKPRKKRSWRKATGWNLILLIIWL